MNKMAKKTKTATDFVVTCSLLQLVIMIVIMIIINANTPTAINTRESITTLEDFKLQKSVYETVTYTESESEAFTEVTIPEATTHVTESTTPEIQPEKEKILEYKYGRRMTPAIDIDIPTGNDMRNFTGVVDTSNYKYLGTYKITGYTPKCVHCCGNDKGITASGVEAIAGYTVATHKNLSFGTTLYIEGYGYYVVEDRGYLATNVIDIAAPTHDSCYNLTNNEVNVYVVPH